MAAMNCKALRVLLNPFFHKDLCRRMATMPTGRAADPDVHSEDPEEVEAVDAIREHGLNQKGGGKTENRPASASGGTVPNSSAATTRSPLPSSPKVESVGVNAPINPRSQQKREIQADAAICASLELPDDDETRRQRKEQEEEDKKYFSNRKASPLSEIEFADTRKPITQATDGTANEVDGISSGGGGEEVGEEDSLERAAEMWKQSRERATQILHMEESLGSFAANTGECTNSGYYNKKC